VATQVIWHLAAGKISFQKKVTYDSLHMTLWCLRCNL